MDIAINSNMSQQVVLRCKSQHDLIYSKLLPYSDVIDDESDALLNNIKENLAKSIQLRDVKVGTCHWSIQLTKYIRFYGYKFSKEDHVNFVHLMYQLIITPKMELALVQRFGAVLCTLLKKNNLLSRDDLVLPWRPLHCLLDDTLFKSQESNSLLLLPMNFDSTLKSIVRCCRLYFSEESTREMLDEWLPLLCPFDTTVIHGLSCMELFLPTLLPPEKHQYGFKLWLQNLLDLWYSFRNAPSWEASIVQLFSRLASDNIGYIEWEAHLPMIFTRILRSFNLPVGSRHISYTRQNCYDISSVAKWIVAMMGGSSSVLDHIQKLMGALHSFIHPSNSGRWSVRLSLLLQALPFQVVKRIQNERYRKPSWKTPVPESHRLKDAEITRFVEILKPVVFTAMFDKMISQASAIRSLSMLRPEIIIPTLLDKTYPAMETLIEPHRLSACLLCLVSTARTVLTSSHFYSDGPSHLLPLLQLSLPGIDPNDFKKSVMTLQMIAIFAALVPMKDCSEASQVCFDLTQQETELCSASAQFEDIVLEILNRILLIIESSSQEALSGYLDSLTVEQSTMNIVQQSTVCSILQQVSTPIFMSALHKINRFIMENVYETNISGRLAANLCRACSKTHPEASLKLMLPPLCAKITCFASEHPELLTEEHLDNSFLWNMLMLSQVFFTMLSNFVDFLRMHTLVSCVNGACLLPYRDLLAGVMDIVLQLHSRHGVEIAGQILRFMLRSLCLSSPLEIRGFIGDIDLPLAEYLPIRHIAKPGDIDNLQLQWYVPTEETMLFAQSIISSALTPQLDFIHQLSPSTVVSKQDLYRRLCIIQEVLVGAGSLLPIWDGEAVHLRECRVPLSRFVCRTMSRKLEITLCGKNVRSEISEAMRKLLGYMKQSREDDTLSMFKIIQIYNYVMMHYGVLVSEVDSRSKAHCTIKEALVNPLNTKKEKHIRPVIIDRVVLLHEKRMQNSSPRVVTTRHKDLMLDLLDLSLSRYREVRKRAQNVLHHSFNYFGYSYLICVPKIVSHLRNPDVCEHELKGSLHLMLGQSTNNRCLATHRNWDTISQLWPAIAQAQQYEKPSILRIIDEIICKVTKIQDTIALSVPVSAKCLQLAQKLLFSDSLCLTSIQPLSPEQIEQSTMADAEENSNNLRLYTGLAEELAALIESGKLTWKFSRNAVELLTLLLREDTAIPFCIVQLFTKHCVNDLISIRKLSLLSLAEILKNKKRRSEKVVADLHVFAGTAPCLPGDEGDAPGDRADNAWHQYDFASLPDSQEKWEASKFVGKTHYGYYCWPKELMVYVDSSKQANFLGNVDNLEKNEQVVFECFSDACFVEKLIRFLSLEEQKGCDRLQMTHTVLFQYLFRNFGDSFLHLFKPHLERLIQDVSHDKHDSSQRCAMEVICGLIRGSKHWPYERAHALWEWLLPMLTFARNNITVETLDDWGTFYSHISESRDPRQLCWLFEMLLDTPISGEGGAFGSASRLLILQQALMQQEWRVPQILHRVLEYLTPHLDHSYKAVRDRMGSFLCNIFAMDYGITPRSQNRSPQRSSFLQAILPQLEPLMSAQLDPLDTTSNHSCNAPLSSKGVAMEAELANDRGDEQRRIIRLCKTVLHWLSEVCVRCFNPFNADMFPLLPVIFNLSSVQNDEDLRQCCFSTLTNLSSCLLDHSSMPAILATFHQASGLSSWHARVALLRFMQVSVFGNFFLLQSPDSLGAIRELLLHLLCDGRLEVREVAATTLSGAIHCGFLHMNADMLAHFEHLRLVTLKKCGHSNRALLEKLIKRHAGVLGLSACVQAYPYDVPDFIPQVLMDLSIHVNDPQPIQMTVKKTLSDFRRTHHDNWHDHKQMFTDDQLAVLTDLLISPNYYA